MNEADIQGAAQAGLNWLKQQEPVSVKGISRTLQALTVWGEDTSRLSSALLSKQKNGYWETDKTLLDTARAGSALAGCWIIQPETIRWIHERQDKGCWNENEIDTAYALIALGDMGVRDEEGCDWLCNNYTGKWEHAGTTALIITALFKQDKELYRDFIKDRQSWILSKRESGGWVHIATSNLVIQALVLTGDSDMVTEIEPSIVWLLGKQESNNPGNINSMALSLISLKVYLDKLNSDLLL
ncbi:MAG: hypothetical protein ACNA7I_06655 [Candidatus Methanoperedens sp.]